MRAMDSEPIEQLKRQLVVPRTGPGRRGLRAARRLAAAGTPAAVAALAEAAVKVLADHDQVRETARRAFAATNDQGVVNAVCSVWAETRNVWLTDVLTTLGWLPTEPLELRVLTALGTGRSDVLADADPDSARALAVIADDEPELREAARIALAELSRQDARDAVCRQAIEGGGETALEVALQTRHAPSSATHHALLLFLGAEFARYAELDPDGSLLCAAHEVAHDRIRARLARRARTSGRVDWVRAIAGGRQDRLDALTEDEWESITGVLTDAEQWPELWRMALQAPPRWSAPMLRALREQHWRPEAEADRERHSLLVDLAARCPETVPSGAVFYEERTVPGPGNPRFGRPAFALSPNGALAALSSSAGTGEVTVWHVPSGERFAHLTNVQQIVKGVVITQDLTLVTVGSNDGGGPMMRVAGLPDGRNHSEVHGWGVAWEPLVGTPAGDRVVAGTKQGALRSHDLDIAANGPGIDFAALAPVRSLAVTPDGAVLAGGDDFGRVYLWRLADGMPEGVLEGHQGGVGGLAVTQDGTLLAAAGQTGEIRLWHLPSKEPAGTLSGPSGVRYLAANPDSSLLLAGAESGEIRMWRLPAGEEVGGLEPGSDVCGLAMTPDGGTVVVGHPGSVAIWRSALHALVTTPAGRIEPGAIQRCRATDGTRPAERAWLDLAAALANRHHHVAVSDVGPRDEPMSVEPPAGVLDARQADSGRADSPTITELIGRHQPGSAAYPRLAANFAEDLRRHPAGRTFARQILRGYADATVDVVRDHLGETGPVPAQRWKLVAVGDTITSADRTRPAIDWARAGHPRLRRIGIDDLGTHPYIHLPAALRVMTDVIETDPGDADRAWFLLATWISSCLGEEEMQDPDRGLIVDLIACCAHLQALVGGVPPAFATEAIEHELTIRHFTSEVVQTASVRTQDGEAFKEVERRVTDSGQPLHVGALLATHLRRDAAAREAARADLALGTRLAEAHALPAARAALERARNDPQLADEADARLTHVFAEESAEELLHLFWTANGDPDCDQIRRIGHNLHRHGGYPLMVEALRHFRALNHAEAGVVAIAWNGIEGWQT